MSTQLPTPQIISFTYFLVHCKWSHWSQYGKCSKGCGIHGVQRKTRKIIRNAQYGGKSCTGSKTQTRACNRVVCTGDNIFFLIFKMF